MRAARRRAALLGLLACLGAAALPAARAGISGIWAGPGDEHLRIEQLKAGEVRIWHGVDEDGECVPGCEEQQATRSAQGLGGMLRLAPDVHGKVRAARISPGDSKIIWDDVGQSWERRKTLPQVVATPRGGIVAYIGDNLALTTTRHGLMLLLLTDNTVSVSQLLYGEWCEVELSILLDFVKEGDMVIDVGAHIGSFAIPLAKRIGARGRLIAFEPQPFLQSILGGNLALNDLSNAEVYPSIASNASRVLMLPTLTYETYANYGALSFARAEPFEAAAIDGAPKPVEVRTIDSLAFDGKCPALIKIDAEEMELQVLQGAMQTVMRCRPVMFMEGNTPESIDGVLSLFASMNYEVHLLVVSCFSSSNFRGESHNIFHQLPDTNYVALPSERRGEWTLAPQLVQLDMSKRPFTFSHYAEALKARGVTVAD